MRRREVLASGATLLATSLAGCGHPPVVLDLEEATAVDIANEVSMTADPGSEEYRVVQSALENGSATRRGRHELFDAGEPVRVDDAFYEVSETRLGSSDVTVYEVLVDLDPTEATPERGEITFEELPEADRQRLEPLISEEPPERDGYDVGVSYGIAEEVGNESVFVPEPEYDVVVHEGDRLRVDVDSRTVTETEYRYEVTEVAPDVVTFADQIRAQYRFALTGLSDAEREVVEEAIDGAYFEDDEAFRSVVERIRRHDGLNEEDFYGTWLLEYEGTEYLTYAEW